MKLPRVAAMAALTMLFLTLIPSQAVLAGSDVELQSLRDEIAAMKQTYENRISQLEAKLEKLEYQSTQVNSAPVIAAGNSNGNEFNPSIGLILNGQYAAFSANNGEISGFAPGEEGERGSEGFAIGESEVNLATNIDDKFYGSMTAAIVPENGQDNVELEEAFIQTLPGAGLPLGATLKFGRALWTFGYLNDHHRHTDDFADRPLPYRVFLNNAFNDDGVEFSYVLPTDLYSEVGAGLFRGDDYPFGVSDGNGIDAWSAYARVGGDIGDNQSWRFGGYVLSGKAEEGRNTNEDMVTFTGDSDLYAADLRYTWAPTGNPNERELTFQGEYFRRYEDGSYEDMDLGTGLVAYDDHDSGWYIQGVYKFHPQWRIGARFSLLNSPDVPTGLLGSVLDAEGHDPRAYALMADWSNSEFSRIRLQYNHEELTHGQTDNQIILQYIMSLGAHGAHNY